MRFKYYNLITILILIQIKSRASMLNKRSPDESDKISIIMETMLPSMFGLFSNITDADFKSNFKEPCTFDQLLDLFSQLPPYFDQIAKKYPDKPDLVAYYSMQLASTFLVNNGSLTMTCLYNMLSLQTRLQTFSLDLMDNPEKNMQLVGVFGIFMKPIMSRLKKNAMMKIIEHVDKYEKNDNLNTISIFNFINIFYCLAGLISILSNTFLIILLKRTNSRYRKTANPNPNPNPKPKNKIYKSFNSPKNVTKKLKSKYKQVKSHAFYLNQLIRKKYKTRFLFIIIAACHSCYILLNFIVMSQAGLASIALKGLTQMNLACKMAFFLFPPTTAYNILHQIAIWLLVFAVRKHGLKLRRTKTHNFDENADYDVDVMNVGYSDEEDEEDEEEDNYAFERNLYDTGSNRTGNDTFRGANHQKSAVQFTDRSLVPFQANRATGGNLQIMSANHFHQHNYFMPYDTKHSKKTSSSLCRGLFTRKCRNFQFFVLLLILLFAYNSQNMFLYSLNRLQHSASNTIYFCAFEDSYSEYYVMLSQYIVPLTNLILFSLGPLLLCTIQVLFDACFLVRVKREQLKRYMKLREIIEWPVYLYYLICMLSQLPFALHQIIDLIAGSTKFPFVFPLFIQMKFTSKIWLVVFEQTLIFIAFSSDLFIWLACDKHVRELARCWLNKRILCRTYSKTEIKNNQELEVISSSSRTSTKSASDSSVINDDSIKSHVSQSQVMPNGYESSTLSSTNSSTNKKKQLSTSLVESIKASAAKSASIQHNAVYPYEKAEEEMELSPSTGIKMIDTENDDLDYLNDFSIDHNHKQNLERLGEIEDEKNYSKNYSFSSNPPTFSKAVGRAQYANLKDTIRN